MSIQCLYVNHSKENEVYKKVDKLDIFSKIFAQLKDDQQDKLITMAHSLLETHQIIQSEKENDSINENKGTKKNEHQIA